MQKRKGFTLVELVIVIAVIAILAGVLIGTFASVINRANDSAKLQEIKAQEIEQKANDIIKKIEDSNWFGWEDYEADIVAKLTEAYVKNKTTESAVEDAVTTALANIKVGTSDLTEDQVKAIIENALGTVKYEGVTEAQVKAALEVALGDVSTLTSAQVKEVVEAANAKNLTAADLAKAVAGCATLEAVKTALSSATASLATAEQAEAIKNQLNELVQNTVETDDVVTAKALNIKIAKAGLTNVATPYDVVSKIKDKPTSANILFDLKNVKFFVVDNDGKVYNNCGLTLNSGEALTNKHEYWIFADTKSDTYSTYLTADQTSPVVLNGVGLDVGEATVESVTYSNGGADRTVVIRTNGGTLTINAKNDDVFHYGYADSVNVIDVATASYHENGTVKFLEVAAGHIVLEEDAEVSAVHFTATGEGNEAKFENAEGKTISIDLSKVSKENMPSFSRDAVTIAENGTYVAEVITDGTEYIWLFGNGIKEQMVVTESTGAIAENGTLKTGVTAGAEEGSVAEQIANPAKRNDEGQLLDANDEVVTDPQQAVVEQVASKEDVQTGATLFGGGSGTENDPYMIRCREHFENIDVVSGSFKYFVVDVESELWSKDSAGNKYMDATGWITIELNGVLYGNNLKIKNLSNTLFDMKESDSDKVHRIEKLDIDCAIYKTTRASALLVNTPVKLELDSIYVHGIIQGSQVGSFVLFVEDCGNDLYLHIKNCQSDANLIGTTNANGFFSHIYLTTRNINDTIKIENSQFIGSLMTNVEDGKACYIGDNTGGTRKGGITFEVDEASRFYNGVSLVNWESYESTSGNRRVALDPYTYTVNGVVQKQSLNKIDNTALPDKYAAFSVAKNTSATSAKAVFVIAPNGNGTTVMGGGFDSTYMKEDSLELTDGYYITDLIKYFDIEINGSTSVSKEYAGSSGLSSDGRTFNVINSSYGHNYGSAQVVIIQYNGTAIVQIDVFNLPE